MSTDLSLMLIAASVLALAVGWIVLTRRSKVAPKPLPEPLVVWLRSRDEVTPHAFRTAELHAGMPQVQALAFCGQWLVTELIGEDGATRCVPCARAVEAMKDRD